MLSRACANLNRFVLYLFCLFSGNAFSLLLHGQCGTSPAISLSGNGCAGSVLQASTNTLPATVTWQLNGSTTVATQTLTAASGSTAAGGNGAGANAAQLRNPNRIFIDNAGNLYIPDMGNNRVQKWAPGATSGITVAGGNGVGSAANQFDRATSVFTDAADNVYVTDQNNNRIQKWAPGAVTGTTVVSGLSYPTALFINAGGDIYVSEQLGSKVTRWAPGATTGQVVAGGNGYGSSANQLSAPTGIYVDAAGNLYVCDTDNNRVTKWAPGATTGVTVAGGNGYGSSANQLANPLGVYVDAAGAVYITDYNNYRVQKWPAGAAAGITVAGGNGSGAGNNQFNQPAGISMDAACNLYVSDFFNHRVQKFSMTAQVSYTATQPGTYVAVLSTPAGATLTSNAVTVLPLKTPQVSITADTLIICPGTAVSFSATPVNGGGAPVFQWKKNGIVVGTNAPVYTDPGLKDGDLLSCLLTSNEACLTRPTAQSNVLQVRVRKPHVPVNLGPDVSLCDGETKRFTAGTYDSYRWQDGSVAPDFSTGTAGTYFVQVQDACGTSSDTVSVLLYTKPSIFSERDTFFCTNESVLLQSRGNFTNYLWGTGDMTQTLTVRVPGTYRLQVTGPNGCVWSDSMQVVRRNCNNTLYVPSAFTPNGDGKNDRLSPVFSRHVRQYDFFVYNRWGRLVFRSASPSETWDGKVAGAPQGNSVFVWVCTFRFEGEEVKTEKGTVTLIR